MNYSKSPSRTTKIKSESFLKPKVTDAKGDSCRKLQDELFAVLRQNKDLQARTARLQNEAASVTQTSKDESKAFLSRLKKAVEHKAVQRSIFNINDPFVGKHFDQIREALHERGYPVGEIGKPKEAAKDPEGPRVASSRSTTILKSQEVIITPPDTSDELVRNALTSAQIQNLPSRYRAILHSKKLETEP
jgi:hypothetical protein